MATAEQIKALIRSHTEGADAQFLSVASQMAAHAARTGKPRLADDLLLLVKRAKLRRNATLGEAPDAAAPAPAAIPLAQPPSALGGLVTASYPRVRLAEMTLDPRLRDSLARVLSENRQADRLLHHGFRPRRKLLLVGPPGCGKSMTAAALAGELSLPLLAVAFHQVITRFMGESSAKLHAVFEAMTPTRGVYLFDELDAIGFDRADAQDVGESRRILNAFLGFLERDTSDSLVVAASNLPDRLDPALFRRFDDVLRYGPPAPADVRPLVENRLARFGHARLSWKAITAAAEGLTQADVVAATEDAAKEAVLDGRGSVRSAELVAALRKRHRVA